MVSNIFYFHPYLGKIPILANIFQRGWFNHQLADLWQEMLCFYFYFLGGGVELSSEIKRITVCFVGCNIRRDEILPTYIRGMQEAIYMYIRPGWWSLGEKRSWHWEGWWSFDGAAQDAKRTRVAWYQLRRHQWMFLGFSIRGFREFFFSGIFF